jgi:Amt family ammonium transporter
VLVFFMQCGFAMLEAGAVRAKNTKNILIKNLLDACLGSIVWYLTGYGIAYGGSNDNPFFGTGYDGYAIHDMDWDSSYTAEGSNWSGWFFQFTFAAAAATIVSGGVAERCALGAYMTYSLVLTGLVYPIVVHMAWDSSGVISAFNTGSGPSTILGGVVDFAGSGVVHMTGGIAALIGAFALGPRIGRFDPEGKPVAMPGHSSVLQILGTFILWVGWYGFNCGSTLAVFALDTQYARDVARIACTTTLGAASGGVMSLAYGYALTHTWDVGALSNGVLAGLVSVTSGCSVIELWAAIVIGFIGALIFNGSSKLMLKLKIDDPLDAFAVHGACGMWGVLATGAFCHPDYSYNLAGAYGFLYGGDNGVLLGPQVVFVLIIWLWVGSSMSVVFFSLKALGMLRVPAEVEEMGLDRSKHGGNAYDVVGAKK